MIEWWFKRSLFLPLFFLEIGLNCAVCANVISIYGTACRSEGRAEKLWIPGDSPYISNKVGGFLKYSKKILQRSAPLLSVDDAKKGVAGRELPAGRQAAVRHLRVGGGGGGGRRHTQSAGPPQGKKKKFTLISPSCISVLKITVPMSCGKSDVGYPQRGPGRLRRRQRHVGKALLQVCAE